MELVHCFLSWVVVLPGSFAVQFSLEASFAGGFSREMESVAEWGSGLSPLSQNSPGLAGSTSRKRV